MTKTALRKKTNYLVSATTRFMRRNIEKAIESGCMDIKGAEDNLLLPKALLLALFKEESRQISAKGTSFEKAVKKEAENIYRNI